jgi:DNA-binding NtrC family response regulator
MSRSILLVTPYPSEHWQLSEVLEGNDYRTVSFNSLIELYRELEIRPHEAVILDLDALPVDNRFFKEFHGKHPGVCIVGLSSRTFHPELEEAMRHHISACLSKPLKAEELIFWLRGVCGEELDARASQWP